MRLASSASGSWLGSSLCVEGEVLWRSPSRHPFNVALQTAIRHPEVVRKLVVASAPSKSDGVYPEIRALMASFTGESSVLSPNREAYVRTAPKPEDWPWFVAKARPLLIKDYDWAQDVAAIQVPTLIVVGDADTVLPAHAVELLGLLGGGKADSAMGNLSSAQLAVLPGTTEFGILARIDLLLAIITPFLAAGADARLRLTLCPRLPRLSAIRVSPTPHGGCNRLRACSRRIIASGLRLSGPPASLETFGLDPNAGGAFQAQQVEGEAANF
jgi:hypothetical protein